MANFVAKTKVTIKAPAERVWEALTKPEIIKQYLFDTDVTSDWTVGSSITYRGIWDGQAYEDKGEILDIEPRKILRSTYWSALSGQADMPENYSTVTYELSEKGGKTDVIVVQDNLPTKKTADSTTKNWQQVLKGMKELLEK